MVIHGGAGAMAKEHMSAEMEKAYLSALDSAIDIGEGILRNGGDALDAVEETIRFLEDCPLFNAGKGAVFAHEGTVELDASIMDGRTQQAGAVAGVKIVKNPVSLAREVMEHSPHVFLSGRGAEQFAIKQGLDTVGPEWFFTQDRWDALERARAGERKSGWISEHDGEKFGTVGCVARDQQGNLAAGTSTGGTTNKRWNRIGDSPVIGAGTYADNAVCAISCTGHGEYFIRYAVAHDVWALMAYKGWKLAKAADHVINEKLAAKGGQGGLIAVDSKGNIAMPFNTKGMFRGYAKPGERDLAIYR